MKRCLTGVVVIGVICGGLLAAMTSRRVAAQANIPSDRQAILAADYSLEAAVAKGDGAAADKLLDTDFEWTAPNGKTWTRAEILKNLKALAAEKGDLDQTGLTERFYSGEVGVLYRLTHEPRYTHIWVKRPAGWRALIFFDTTNPPPGQAEPAPDPRPDLRDPKATTDCHNPCKFLPWDDKIAGRPVTVPEKEALASWMRQKHTESTPSDQAAINAWETRTADDGIILGATSLTRYIISWRLQDLIRMWKNKITAPGGPFVISMHVWAFGDDCVIYTALQHPSEHVTTSTSYAVRIWTKKRPPFNGIQNPNPLPWESDHIWQIALSEAVEVPNGTVPPKH